jgi:hypothetical protein
LGRPYYVSKDPQATEMPDGRIRIRGSDKHIDSPLSSS